MGLLRFARFGVDPFTVLMLGMDQFLPMEYGIVYMLVNGVLLFLLSGGAPAELPSLVGLGTIITAFFMGPVIAWFNVYVAWWL